MMFQDFLTQMGRVNVSVDLRRRNGFMSQHRLDGTQVGTALEQMGGKTVAQGVWTVRFPQ